jgi:G:T-mismatch repair DNA endonuclease (very short patch repair protein)
MADVHTKEIRNKNMVAIKGKNTKPEMLGTPSEIKSCVRVMNYIS